VLVNWTFFFSCFYWFPRRLPLLSPLFCFLSQWRKDVWEAKALWIKERNPFVPLLPAFFFTPCLSCIFLLFILLFFSCSFLLGFSLLFMLFFSAPFSSVFLFFLCSFFLPLVRSLEGFIYSLTYLYLEKIQCINSRMQIPADV
jgi:hypothetical protein